MDDLAGNQSNGSFSKKELSLDSRSWASASVRDVFANARPGGHNSEDDEQQLLWAAIQRLPTYDRTRTGIIKQVLEDGSVVHQKVDVAHLGMQDKKQLMEDILKIVEQDNQGFLQRLRDRADRVGIDIPKVEVRCEHLSIDGDAYVGSRALPTLPNASINFLENMLGKLKLFPSNKREINILKNVSSIVKPSRLFMQFINLQDDSTPWPPKCW